MSSQDKSIYEHNRDENIARNNDILIRLGFATNIANADPKVVKSRSPKRKRNIVKQEREGVVRFSQRLRRSAEHLSDITHAAVDNSLQSTTSLAQYRRASPLLTSDELNVSEPHSGITWQSSTMHQHLELSVSGRTVATTGCAGYGGVMARPDAHVAEVHASKSKSHAKSKSHLHSVTWALHVQCEGVGGFAAGVAAVGATKPFKSLGNRPDTWVIHSSGDFLHNRNRTETPLSYGAGDVVYVRVSSEGGLFFQVRDSEEMNVYSALPPGKYVLCCQPYMGGAATAL